MKERQIMQLSNLYGLLASMEAEMGLGQLTEDERKILYAMSELGPDGSDVSSNRVKEHDYCCDISSPTFYRALKRLSERDFIAVAAGRKAGRYHITRYQNSEYVATPHRVAQSFESQH